MLITYLVKNVKIEKIKRTRTSSRTKSRVSSIFKHIDTIDSLCFDFNPKFRIDASDVALSIVHIRLYV